MVIGIAITELFPGAFATLFNAGQSRFIYRSDAGHFDQLSLCRYQCCLSGNLSGAERWHGITCDLSAQTACHYSAIGRNLFRDRQKRTCRCIAYLVGISDHGTDSMSGRVCILKRIRKTKVDSLK